MKKQRKRLLIFFIISIFFLMNIQPILLGDENNPEITDDRNDTYKYWDIINGWFQEHYMRRDLCCITISVQDLSHMVASICIVTWQHNNIKYEVQANITLLGLPKFSAKIYDTQWDSYQIMGNCDYVDNTITFKFPKNDIGSLSKGDELMNITVNLFHPSCYFFKNNSIIYPLINDNATGRNYKIQY